MNFNSFFFFGFLSIVLLLHRLLPWRAGKIMMVIASYLFYGNVNPWYCTLLFISTITDYAAAIQIAKSDKQKTRKFYLWLSIIINIGLLSIFKYGDFFISNFNETLEIFGVTGVSYMRFILPVGISFYTFQTLSYTIDVYRGKTKVCKNFVTFSLYVSYFPQLVAGPIERASRLIPQLAKKRMVDSEQFMHGLERILWGLIKKVVFADRLAVFVNEIFYAPQVAESPVIMFAMVGFILQLYLDFSAYSDIAIGIARLMGVKLSENFNYPMAATSPADFWQRWHITLTRWFGDYVYIPMSLNQKRNPLRKAFNVIFLFVLIGFWHGASWNLIFFGFYAGVTVLVFDFFEKKMKRKRLKNPKPRKKYLQIIRKVIGSPIIFSSAVIFRSPDLDTLYNMVVGSFMHAWSIRPEYFTYIALIIFIYVFHFIRSEYMPQIRKGDLVIKYNRVLTNFILILILIFAAYDYREVFIYFQF